jgi:phosphoglycolate phosphatase-like HAD superfamily hydrolase
VGLLEEEIRTAAEAKRIRLLPGVKELLDALACQPDLALGLVTGNLEQGAQIKLAGAGLTHYFHFGGYGSDSEDRTTLIRLGIQRGTQWVAPAPVEDAIVIGDTPLDIIHGQAAGARVIAVASARYDLAELQRHHPDLLVSDLTPIDRIIAFMRTSE